MNYPEKYEMNIKNLLKQLKRTDEIFFARGCSVRVLEGGG
jgi:hypothetical protein